MAGLSKASIVLLIVLMVIGASPAGTGGGLKTTTFTVLLAVMWSALRGQREVRFWGQLIPLERIWAAGANAGFYLCMLVIGIYLFNLAEGAPFEQSVFEVVSALGTVGLSTGITAGLGSLGKLILIMLMFTGRVGPLTFGAALFVRREPKVQDSDIAV
jgi:trk system potassium uptake protein TrkH